MPTCSLRFSQFSLRILLCVGVLAIPACSRTHTSRAEATEAHPDTTTTSTKHTTPPETTTTTAPPTTTTTTTLPPPLETTIPPTPAPPPDPWARRVNPSFDPATGFVFSSLAPLIPAGAATSGKTVALTFDDGPGGYTQQYLDVLTAAGVPGTFFMITQQLGDTTDQELARRIVAAGSRVEPHTVSHAHLTSLSPEQAQAEIVQSKARIEEVVGNGYQATCLRPPFGQSSPAITALIGQAGMSEAHWSLDTYDWKGPGIAEIFQRVANGASDGDIILMHDGGNDAAATLMALPTLINTLKAAGYQFTTIC